MPMRRPAFACCGVSRAMKRTMMCGCPKYPSPHAAAETTPITEVDAPHSAHVFASSSLMVETIGPMPPSWKMPNTGTATRAVTIIRPCTTSV
jgi:hypothetical protein